MTQPLRNTLRAARQRVGVQQQELAAQIGVSRQTLSAIEAGATAPSTLIALALAQALHCRVEDLFTLGDDGQELSAQLLRGPAASETAAKSGGRNRVRVAMAHIHERWLARTLDGDPSLALGTPADGIATFASGKTGAGTVRVRPLRDTDSLRRNLFVAGCDPALGLLGRHLEERMRGPRLHWIDLASQTALEELAANRVHVAGLHLDDMTAGNLNREAVHKRFGDLPMLMVTLATWELGIVYRQGDGRAPRGVTDLARKGTRIITREPGAGAQQLLLSALKTSGLALKDLAVAAQARGHREVAQMVATNVGDAGIATRAAAAPYGLGFVAVAETRFDLALTTELAADSRVQILLECLSSARFRRDLGAMTGYRTSRTGSTVTGVGN
jgi:putative molybdopterin biosynthesis protein